MLALTLALAATVTAATFTTTTPQNNRLQRIVDSLAVQASPSPAPYADTNALLDDVCRAGFALRASALEQQIKANAQQLCQGATNTQKQNACTALGQPANCGLCN